MALTALRRVTELFDEGKELVLREDPAVLSWINKLNSFEADEARQDGAVARARLILALKEIGTPEKDLYEASLGEMKPEQMRVTLLNEQTQTWTLDAVNELRVDKDWRERVSMIERQGESIGTEQEKLLMDKVGSEYLTEVQARVTEKRSQEERDLQALDVESLKEKHREQWLNRQGMVAFTREYTRSQVYFGLRVCMATKKAEAGGWDHSDCNHDQRACDSREDVKTIPQGLLDKVLGSLREQAMSSDDARFSAGAASSSAPSQRPSVAEESAPSTPEATSVAAPTS